MGGKNDQSNTDDNLAISKVDQQQIDSDLSNQETAPI